MPKTVTLRMKDETYRTVKRHAEMDHRPLSNFIEYAVSKYIEASYFTSDTETREILSDENLKTKLRRGSKDAAARKGRYVP